MDEDQKGENGKGTCEDAKGHRHRQPTEKARDVLEQCRPEEQSAGLPIEVSPVHGDVATQPITFRERRRATRAIDIENEDEVEDDGSLTSQNAGPGAHRIPGIHHERSPSSCTLGSDEVSTTPDGDDGDTPVVHAELAQDIDAMLTENKQLKDRLAQLELEREHLLVVNAMPSPDNQRRTSQTKMDITKASKLVCKTTDEIEMVFSTKSPANGQAGVASGFKNIGKGMAAGVAGLLGEVIAGCASGKGATRAAAGVGKGLAKFFVLPAAGAVVGICQIGRGFANSIVSAIALSESQAGKENQDGNRDNDFFEENQSVTPVVLARCTETVS